MRFGTIFILGGGGGGGDKSSCEMTLREGCLKKTQTQIKWFHNVDARPSCQPLPPPPYPTGGMVDWKGKF